MSKAKGKIGRLEQTAEFSRKLPGYPGREAVEAALRPVLEPWATKWSAAVVMRLIGYWHVHQIVGGRAEIIDRGWMSRTSAYSAEADFRRVFGCAVEDFDPANLPAFILGSAGE